MQHPTWAGLALRPLVDVLGEGFIHYGRVKGNLATDSSERLGYWIALGMRVNHREVIHRRGHGVWQIPTKRSFLCGRFQQPVAQPHPRVESVRDHGFTCFCSLAGASFSMAPSWLLHCSRLRTLAL